MAQAQVVTRFEGTKLVIEIETNVPGEQSKSGKMNLIASTHGFARLPSSDLKLSLNLGR